MSDNELVEAPDPETADPNGTLGAGPVDGVWSTVNSISDGDWAAGLVGGAGAAAGAAGFFSDPLAGLASAGFGWLMEHVDFLKEPLDAVTGDQAEISAISASWTNVSEQVQESAQDLAKAVQKDTESWEGAASTAYNAAAELHVGNLESLSAAANGAGVMVDMCGIVLKVVRDIIRDLISQAVGELVAAALEWVAAEAISLGMATPGMIADLVRRAVKWANKISEWTKKITDVFENAWSKLDELGEGVQKVKTALEKIFGGSGAFGEGNTINRQKIGPDGLGNVTDGVSTPNVKMDFKGEAGDKLETGMKTYFAGKLDDTYNPDDEK